MLNRDFQVSSVAIVPFGLGVRQFFHCKYSILFHEQPDGRLQQARLPRTIKQRNKFIDMLQEHGCYAQENVKVNVSWTHEDINNKLLRVCFPKAFQYFDSQQSTSSLPDWQLLSQNSGWFELCQVAQPSGANLHRNKGCERAGIADWGNPRLIPRTNHHTQRLWGEGER